MRTGYQITRSKRRLVIFLLKLSARGEIINTDLRKLIKDIYEETGEIFAKTEYGVVFESFFSIDSDLLCNPIDKNVGCGDGYDVQFGLCKSNIHKPAAPIVISSIADNYPEDQKIFPCNLYGVCSILPCVKLLPGIVKNVIINFRRDFGDSKMREHWPDRIKFDRFLVKKIPNDSINYGICDIIK